MNLRKSKLREKFRDALRQGVPIPNAYLFTHHYRNNKPSIWLLFKLNEDNSTHATESIQKYTSLIPKVASRAQMSIVKNGLNNMLSMKFAKKSSKLNYIMSTIVESVNIVVKLKQNVKEDVERELRLISDLENHNYCIGFLNSWGGLKIFYEFKVWVDPPIATIICAACHELCIWSRIFWWQSPFAQLRCYLKANCLTFGARCERHNWSSVATVQAAVRSN